MFNIYIKNGTNITEILRLKIKLEELGSSHFGELY